MWAQLAAIAIGVTTAMSFKDVGRLLRDNRAAHDARQWTPEERANGKYEHRTLRAGLALLRHFFLPGEEPKKLTWER